MEGEEIKKEELDGGKRSRWMAHVKKTMRAHKGKSLKQVLKMAAKSYKGGADEGMMGGAPPLSPASVTGGRRRRSTRKSRKGKKGSRKH